jgi:hypothetical protein
MDARTPRTPRTHVSLWRQAVGSDAPALPVRREEIAALAYAKYLNRQDWRGAVDHWLEAERELRCEQLARIADKDR